MAEKTQKEILRELHQAVVGIPESPDDNGLIGAVKDIRDEVRSLNGCVRNTIVRVATLEERSTLNKPLNKKRAIGYGGSVGTAITAIVLALGKILGWW